MTAENHLLSLPLPARMEDSSVEASPEVIVLDVYDRLRPQIASYVCQVIGSGEVAEDLLQEALMRLHEQLRRGVPIANTRGWVYRVVHNLAIDWVRREARRRDADDMWHALDVVTRRPSSPEGDLARRQALLAAMRRLTARERHCLLLRARGLSYREIADVLGININAVSVHLARGLAKCRADHDGTR